MMHGGSPIIKQKREQMKKAGSMRLSPGGPKNQVGRGARSIRGRTGDRESVDQVGSQQRLESKRGGKHGLFKREQPMGDQLGEM